MTVRSHSSITLLLLVAWTATQAGVTHAAAPAVTLDDGNFDENVLKKSKELWLVEFYAPWCGHCKQLTPIFDEAASKARTYGMRMGKMDATASTVIASRYGVKGYPTLIYFRNNEPNKYKASRTVEGFVEFAKTMKQPPVKMVKSRHTLDKLVKDRPVVYFLAQPGVEDPEKTPLFQEFHDAAFSMQDQFKFMGFAANSGPDDSVLNEPRGKGKKALKSGDEPFIVRMERGEQMRYYPAERLQDLTEEDDATGELLGNSTDLANWFERHRHKIFTSLNRFNFYITSHPKGAKSLAVAIVDPQDPKTRKVKSEMHSIARAAAEEHNGEGPTVYGWLDGVEYKEFIEQYGLNVNQLPQIIAFDSSEEQYYHEEGVELPSGMEGFINRLEAGEIFAMRQGFWWYLDMVHFMILEFWPYSLLVVIGYIAMCGWGLLMCKRCICDEDEEEREFMEQMKKLDELREEARKKRKAKQEQENKGD